MKIIIFAGGLGNQMFQYAFFYANKKKHKDLKATTFWYNANKSHNGFELDKVFNISKDGFIFSKNKKPPKVEKIEKVENLPAKISPASLQIEKNKNSPKSENLKNSPANFSTQSEKVNGSAENLQNQNILAQIEKQKELKNVRQSKLTKIIRFILNNNPLVSFLEFNDSKYFENIFAKKGLTILSGYWQNQRYFIEEKSEILNIFQFVPFDNSKNSLQNLQIIKNIEETNSVSIHIRRGDYVANPLYDGVVPLVYYKNAVDFIKSKVQNPHFFIFSDDLVWCKNNLDLPANSIFVDFNSGKNSFRDMQLMSLCKHNIITNSSFSWWGAWLNQNKEKIVIRPKNWVSENAKLDFTEICPEEWVIL